MARPGLGTRCVQAGYSPKNGEPRQIPIIQSTTFKYESSAEMGKLFDLEASGYFYSRLQNPTNDAVAARIAALEGGTAAMLTGSGMSAIFFSVFNIVGAGDHLVSSSSIYGGSFNLFSVTMKRMGVEVTFVDPDCSPEELDAAFRPNTKAMYGETIANPALTVLDIEKFAAAAHRHGVPLILDNTFATPINCRPFEWGADIVVHSTTKYMDGHAGALGGAIVDSGRFDWTKYPDKYPGLCTPDESYHGVTYTERFGLAGAYITKATVQLMRDLGAVQSPQNAYYLNLGLESLHVRMQRHCENAQRVAEFLQRHENVSWVQYCGLPGDKYYELGQKYLPNGSCGVVSFGVRGGRAAAEAVMSKLQVAAIETHVADSHTCCLHPASTTHRQMNAEELLFADHSFDVLVTRNVTWNLHNPEKAYGHWTRVLAPGGLLLNFDANWYRYLWDEEAKRAHTQDRENLAVSDVRDENAGTNVDAMEAIARQTPLSMRARPAWDLKTLSGLGIQASADEEIWRQVWTREERINNASTPMFLIEGRKPWLWEN